MLLDDHVLYVCKCVIYFSFIKHLVIKQTIEQTESSKEVVVWFTQLLCNNVYVHSLSIDES